MAEKREGDKGVTFSMGYLMIPFQYQGYIVKDDE
jgi:hypothetical protein